MTSDKDLKILVVDDLPENIVALSAVLKQEGYSTVPAKSGAEALELLNQYEFGLVLLDVQMPKMDGFEVAQKIKLNINTQNIPIVFLTANTDRPELKIKGHEVGGLEYLTKPLDTELLLLKVKNLFEFSLTQKKLKQANKELKVVANTSELSFENLFFSSPDEIFIFNDNGIITKINRSSKLSMGVYASELIGKHISQLPFKFTITSGMHDDHYDHDNEARGTPIGNDASRFFEVVMKNGVKGQLTEVTLTDKGGKTIYYEITSNLIHTANLDRYLQVNIRDITRRKDAQLLLKKSEKTLKEAQSLTKLGSWEADIQTQTSVWSDEMYKVYEVSKNSFIHSKSAYLNLLYHDDRSKMATWIENVIKGIIPAPIEVRITKPDGSIKYILEKTGLAFDDFGKPIRAFGTAQDITDQKLAKEALVKSEDKFRRLIETTNEMISTLSLEGNILWVNRSWKENLGYTDEEITGKDMTDFAGEESNLQFKKTFLEVLQGNSKFIQRCLLNKSGKEVFVEGTVVPIFENNVVISVQAFFKNITARVKAENKSELSHLRLNEAQRIAKIGSWELDLVTNVLEWSDEVYRIFEINPALFGASYEAFLDTIHPDDRENVNKAYSLSLVAKQPYKITHRLKFKDGRIKYIEEQCETFYDSEGNAIKSIGTTQDITEKHIANERIAKSEERFSLAMEGANDGLWEWNILTNERYFSPRWKSMLGYTDNELLSRETTWASLLHPDDFEKAHLALKNYLDGKTQVYNQEFRMKHKNGQYVEILSRGKAVKNSKEEIIKILGTHVDITESRKTQNFLTLLNEGASVKTGNSFFAEFTKFCCVKLGVKCALIGQYIPGENAVETISFAIFGKEQENIKYDLEHTPCNKVINTDTCFYPDDIQARYPKDDDLRKLNAQSYFGLPLRDENNNVLGIMVLLDDKPMIDFEENKKVLLHLLPRISNELSRNITETKLLESGVFTKGILDSLSSHIAVVDEDGQILVTNNSWDTFSLNNNGTDLTKTSVGSNYFEVCQNSAKRGDKIAGKVLTGIYDVLNKKIHQFQIEYPCHSPETERWFSLTVTPYLDNTPKVVVRHVDITSRRKTEQKIKLDSEILSSINDAVIYSDLDLNVIELNKNAETLYGWKKSEIAGKKYPQELKFDFLNGMTLNKMIVQLIKNGKCKYEIIAKTKHQQSIYLSVNSSVLNNIGGIPIGIVSVQRDITEKREQERALEISELNYKELFEQSPFGVATLDLSGKIQSVNSKITEFLGITKQQIIGQNIVDNPFNIHPIAFRMKEIFIKTLKSKTKSLTFEAISKAKTGAVKNYEIDAKFIKEIEKVTLIVRDITKQKKSEEFNTLLFNIASHANSATVNLANFGAYLQKELAIYFNTENFCISSYDRSKNELEFLYFNDGTRKHDEAPSKRQYANGLTEYIIQKKLALLLNGNDLTTFLIKNDLEVDGPKSMCWMGVPLISGSDAVGAIAMQSYNNMYEYSQNDFEILRSLATIIAPIIEKLKIDQKLLLIDSAIESAGDAIFITNPLLKNNPIVFANQKLFDLTNYNSEELYNKNYNLFFGLKTNKQIIAKIKEAFENHSSFQGEVLSYRKDNSTYWTDLTINPVKNKEGKVINFIGIQKDITEKKKLERLLIEKNKELELFMYRASHDLKGPLSTSKGLVNFAIEECRDNNTLHYLRLLEKSNNKLDNILSDLMEIVIIREGMIEKTSVKLEDLLKEVIETKEVEIYKQNDINLIFDIDLKEDIMIDAKLLKIILRNIYNNAIKYSNLTKKGSYVSLSAKIIKQQLEITVADNGIGINSKYLPKVFDMFFRATESSTGTGLGLYITKNAVDKLNGTLNIESKEKEGTLVTIKIPV